MHLAAEHLRQQRRERPACRPTGHDDGARGPAEHPLQVLHVAADGVGVGLQQRAAHVAGGGVGPQTEQGRRGLDRPGLLRPEGGGGHGEDACGRGRLLCSGEPGPPAAHGAGVARVALDGPPVRGGVRRHPGPAQRVADRRGRRGLHRGGRACDDRDDTVTEAADAHGRQLRVAAAGDHRQRRRQAPALPQLADDGPGLDDGGQPVAADAAGAEQVESPAACRHVGHPTSAGVGHLGHLHAGHPPEQPVVQEQHPGGRGPAVGLLRPHRQELGQGELGGGPVAGELVGAREHLRVRRTAAVAVEDAGAEHVTGRIEQHEALPEGRHRHAEVVTAGSAGLLDGAGQRGPAGGFPHRGVQLDAVRRRAHRRQRNGLGREQVTVERSDPRLDRRPADVEACDEHLSDLPVPQPLWPG